jgi:parallel beta-helix repeat protein
MSTSWKQNVGLAVVSAAVAVMASCESSSDTTVQAAAGSGGQDGGSDVSTAGTGATGGTGSAGGKGGSAGNGGSAGKGGSAGTAGGNAGSAGASCPTDCDDSDPCTTDQKTASTSTCSFDCSHVAISACTSGDGCCPASCTRTGDSDCPFHVDATGGKDTNDGLTPQTAWKTAERASTEKLSPGDRLAFKRGEVWHETFHIAWSGSQQAPIVITSYGSATEPPVFAPTQAVTSFNAEANKIYSASLTTKPRQVVVDGVRLRFAHFPNDGYLSVDQNEVAPDGGVAKTSFLDNDLTQSADQLVGATVLMRGDRWQLYTSVVSAYSNHRVTLYDDPNDAYDPLRGMGSIRKDMGYILANKLWMLDAPGEWFYDAAAQKLYLRLVGDADPSSHQVEISPDKHGIELASANHIIIDGLGVRHAGQDGVDILKSDGIHVRNCSVENSGMYGVHVDQPPAAAVIELDHNVIRTSNFAGISLSAAEHTEQNVVIRGNRVEDTGSDFPVASGAAYGWGYGTGIYLTGGGALVEENVVQSAGYSCALLIGTDHQVLHNNLQKCCLLFDDGGGIYVGGTPKNVGSGHVIRGNTVVDSMGNKDGTSSSTTAGQGIYIDVDAHDVVVEDNTIVNTDWGLQLHVTHNNTLRGNTVFASRRSGLFASAGCHDNVVEQTVFFSASGAPAIHEAYDSAVTVAQVTYNKNRYWHQEGKRPMRRKIGTSTQEYTLEEWRAATGFDALSTDLATAYHVSPDQNDPADDAQILLNPTSTERSVDLGNTTYCDLNDAEVSGTVIVPPFSSKVLLGCKCNMDKVCNNHETAASCSADCP